MKSIEYGLKYPEGTDRPRDLPTHLKQVVESIRDALNSFNYNGKDPNLVLARVAALESNSSASGGTAAGSTTITAKENNNTTSVNVTFPAGKFTRPPTVVMQYLGGPGNAKYFTIRPVNITATGFEAQVYNTHPTAALSCPVSWIAVAE